ncbi:class I SAM-dependent methyltransferase [Nonomuraea soli]|uniref:O-methyltransferase involved in polyketide biosynthesis n=1 Tax=Nonomuraea soli TaxID=1032476 RepID=A0A7W0HSJ0_9ACTN|nr:class I SAM-dependent methyltransferase [Nonomuraea soli]MBA2894055.1 O-methyltransferase involved in polyketide biosynthesis [Nonomuraea soli]
MEKIRLTGAQATMLATLYGKAVDAGSPRSILHDTMALDAIGKIDHDFSKVGMKPGDAATVALRSLHFDGWTREFLAAHPSCTVLHLGCGMDTRVFRIGPGSGVRWYDVDYPDVIDLRRKLYPAGRPGYEIVATSVTPPGWLDRVPADLPVLVVAEGLTMYLREEEGRELLRRIVEHFPGGQLVFDAFSRRGIRMQRMNKPVQVAGARLHWGVDGAAELTSVHPRLRCLDAVSAFDIGGYDQVGLRYRALVGVARMLPFMRRMAVMYRLAF